MKMIWQNKAFALIAVTAFIFVVGPTIVSENTDTVSAQYQFYPPTYYNCIYPYQVYPYSLYPYQVYPNSLYPYQVYPPLVYNYCSYFDWSYPYPLPYPL